MGIGISGTMYALIAFRHPGYGDGLLIPPTFQWPGEPQLLIAVSIVAEILWLLSTLPVLIAGFSRLRAIQSRATWRRGAFFGAWIGGIVLMMACGQLFVQGENGSSGLAPIALMFGAGWIVLGLAIRRMVARPQD